MCADYNTPDTCTAATDCEEATAAADATCTGELETGTCPDGSDETACEAAGCTYGAAVEFSCGDKANTTTDACNDHNADKKACDSATACGWTGSRRLLRSLTETASDADTANTCIASCGEISASATGSDC